METDVSSRNSRKSGSRASISLKRQESLTEKVARLKRQHANILAAIETVNDTRTAPDLVASVAHLEHLWRRHCEDEKPLMDFAWQAAPWDPGLEATLEMFSSDIEQAARMMERFIFRYRKGIRRGNSVTMRAHCLELETMMTASIYIEERHIFPYLEHFDSKSRFDVLSTIRTSIARTVNVLAGNRETREQDDEARRDVG